MNAMIHWYRKPSPLGTMRIVACGDALVGVYFDGQKYDAEPGPDWCESPDDLLLREAGLQLDAYFAGRLTNFNLAVDPQGTEFQRSVWRAIANVPRGTTISYRDLAVRVGRPASVRASGAATGRNPLSIVVPCHRIVGANGSLTGYAGGLDRKRALLALEQVRVDSTRDTIAA